MQHGSLANKHIFGAMDVSTDFTKFLVTVDF